MPISSFPIIFIEADIINNSAMFQLYHPYSFWGVDGFILYRKFNHSVAKLRGLD